MNFRVAEQGRESLTTIIIGQEDFSDLKSGKLLRFIRKISGHSGRGYWSENNFGIKIRNRNVENIFDVKFFYFPFLR